MVTVLSATGWMPLDCVVGVALAVLTGPRWLNVPFG